MKVPSLPNPRTCRLSILGSNGSTNVFDSVWTPNQNTQWICWVGSLAQQQSSILTERWTCWDHRTINKFYGWDVGGELSSSLSDTAVPTVVIQQCAIEVIAVLTL